jgi:hypothetical protein
MEKVLKFLLVSFIIETCVLLVIATIGETYDIPTDGDLGQVFKAIIVVDILTAAIGIVLLVIWLLNNKNNIL